MTRSDTPYGGHHRVIWTIEVLDREGALEDTENLTADIACEAALVAGIHHEYTVDDDTYPDGTHYVQWVFSVPTETHWEQNTDGIPVAIAAVRNTLRQVVANVGPWTCEIAPTSTWLRGGEDRLRDFYTQELAAIEVAVLPLRSGEAETMEPALASWGEDTTTLIGTYGIYLRPGMRRWTTLAIGQYAPDALKGDGNAVTSARRFGIKPDHLVLVVPPPTLVQWGAELNSDGKTLRRWTAPNAQELATQLASELPTLLND